jgi:hypothetical protein
MGRLAREARERREAVNRVLSDEQTVS